MYGAFDNDDLIAIELDEVEATALRPWAALGGKFLGPTGRAEIAGYGQPDEDWTADDEANGVYWAARLGFVNDRDLEQELDRLSDAIKVRQPLSFTDWYAAINIVHLAMSPGDSEWQTIVGIDYLETATALSSITRKVDLAFGGTFLNPGPGTGSD